MPHPALPASTVACVLLLAAAASGQTAWDSGSAQEPTAFEVVVVRGSEIGGAVKESAQAAVVDSPRLAIVRARLEIEPVIPYSPACWASPPPSYEGVACVLRPASAAPSVQPACFTRFGATRRAFTSQYCPR